MERTLSAAELAQAISETSAIPAESKNPDWQTLENDPILKEALTVTRHADGRIEGKLTDATPDKRYAKRFREITQEARDQEYQRGQNQVASTFVDREPMKRRDTGEVEIMPAHRDESPSFKRKWTTLRKHWNRWTAPKEEKVLRKSPPRIYSARSWMYDCPACGYTSDRWVPSYLFDDIPFMAATCSGCRNAIRGSVR